MRSRALRRHHTERVIRNRAKTMKQYGWHEEAEPHRYHKRHPLDCGNTQCGVCREWEKKEKYPFDPTVELIWDEETLQEMKWDEYDHDYSYYYFAATPWEEKAWLRACERMRGTAKTMRNLLKHYEFI